MIIRKPGGEESRKIIAAAIAVHRRLGPGFLGSIYENALIIELCANGLKVESQVEIPVQYAGKAIGKHRLDLLVEDTIISRIIDGQEF